MQLKAWDLGKKWERYWCFTVMMILAKGKTKLLKYIFKAPDLKPGIQVWTSLD